MCKKSTQLAAYIVLRQNRGVFNLLTEVSGMGATRMVKEKQIEATTNKLSNLFDDFWYNLF